MFWTRASDADREVWVIEDGRSVPFGPWSASPLVLLFLVVLLGPFGVILGLGLLLMMSTDPTRTSPRTGWRRYRRLQLDATGLRVDAIEAAAAPSERAIVEARGRRAQHVRWEEITRVERVSLRSVVIHRGGSDPMKLPHLPPPVARELHERLVRVATGVQQGAPDADQAARRRAQLEALLAERQDPPASRG